MSTLDSKFTVLDLFSGIGGFALAIEEAGFETKAFAEIEDYPSKVLKQHWPDVPNLGDVRGINGKSMCGSVDVVCGGFPCQDISLAGKGAGIKGKRSGLWFEMCRIIDGARPAFCLIENVPALRSRGYDEVQTSLEEAGYSARPFVVGAIHARAPHKRSRVWIIAYDKCQRTGRVQSSAWGQNKTFIVDDGQEKSLANPNDAGQSAGQREGQSGNDIRRRCKDVSNTMPERFSLGHGGAHSFGSYPEPAGIHSRLEWSTWDVEPDVGRVAYGVPKWVDRIKALGNSVVPAVVYPFAKFIYQELMKNGTTRTT